jgi:hypothetical protein
MIRDLLDRTIARVTTAEETRPGIDKLSRRALGALAGAVTFAGLSKTVRAQYCEGLCDEVTHQCTPTYDACTTVCGSGGQCWESGAGQCCDYVCEQSCPPYLCCSRWS